MPARGTDHRVTPRYEEVERQYASLPRYGIVTSPFVGGFMKQPFLFYFVVLSSLLSSIPLIKSFCLLTVSGGHVSDKNSPYPHSGDNTLRRG